MAIDFAVVVSMVLGTAIVALHIWKSAQAPSSVGHPIYETNTNPARGKERAS